jgi:hypothetical protein
LQDWLFVCKSIAELLVPVHLLPRKRQVLAVWTVLVSIGILPSGHYVGVHLEDYGHFESSDVV